MEVDKFIVSFLLLSSLAATLSLSCSTAMEAAGSEGVQDENLCVYTLYIRTGSVFSGGTNAVISLTLGGSDGSRVAITNLVSWGGLQGPGHDYFERGNLDIFGAQGLCLSTPPCWMNLTSDGSGSHPGWYCNYVEVTTARPGVACAQQLFTVEQWLAISTRPYQLFAVRDYCRSSSGSGTTRRLVGRGAEPMPEHAV